MASSDFSVPQQLNPGVDRSPAAPAVTRRIYIPPSNGNTFVQNGDLQFRLPTAEPGSILDARYTYMKFTVTIDYSQGTGGTGTQNTVMRWPACGGNSLFERLEVYQGGVPVEQIGHYNVIAKKFFQQESGKIDVPSWYPAWFRFNDTTISSSMTNDPSTQYEAMTKAHCTWSQAVQTAPTTKTFEICIPIMSGLVGVWSEKYLPLMLLGVSSFYLNFKLTDVYSFLEPVWSSQTGDFGVPWSVVTGSDRCIGMDIDPNTGLAIDISSETTIQNPSNLGYPTGFTLSNVELVCTQILLLPSVTQLVYANANQNSISWTTTSRRDYPQIMSGTAGGWTDPNTIGTATSTAYDLIIPCRLQSVRNFDLIMTYIGTAAFTETAGALTNWWHPYDHLYFLNPNYTSTQFKKGSDFFPQRPITQNILQGWPTGYGAEQIAESLIADDDWFPFGKKCGYMFIKDEWVASGPAPWFKQLGTYVSSRDCRTFRGVDSSTRSGISFEKEQFNVAFTIVPQGGNILGNVTQASLPIAMSNFRFHFIPTYDIMVTITPTGSMEVAY